MCFFQAYSQRYFTRTGFVNFFSEAPLENIEAQNNQATCIVDIESGEVVSRVLMNAFQFEKALMQEHFNENYVESDKYPQASFKAQIKNLETLDFESKSKQEVILEGELTIKDVTKKVTIAGEFYIDEDIFYVSSSFIIEPADYNINIPRAVRNNIAKEIEVSLVFKLEEFKR
jgi:polyisoprenoid-binding protein YceI